MTPDQASAILRTEMNSDTMVSKALLVLLQDSEMKEYRQSVRTQDPVALAKITGRGEGLHNFINRIAPREASAQPGREADSAAGAP
jgi:hypothetical protein